MKKESTHCSSEILYITPHLDEFDEKLRKKYFAIPKKVSFINNGLSEFVFVQPSSCSELLSDAIIFFVESLSKMSENYAFNADSKSEQIGKRIFFAPEIGCDKSCSDIIADGYRIIVKEHEIRIYGNTDSGTANGIYGFLEDYLDCMFVRSDYDYIPKYPTVYLDESDVVFNPDFSWRNQFQYEVYSTNWYKKLKSNGSVDNAWGNTSHSVFSFVEPDVYFDKHPEYFSLRHGKRVKEQLCLSNPDIFQIISKKMQQMIDDNPQAVYWDFSINDNLHYCQCKNCKTLYSRYKNKIGSILLILNKLAKEHPDKIFSTLAYTYNEKAPCGIAPMPNVNIKLAPIKSGQKYSYAFSESKKARRTNNLISSWGSLANNLYIWDYIVDFQHLLMPYPNYDVQRNNLRFYKQNNVKLVFHQGMYSAGTELAQFRSYIMAKQLWNIECNISVIAAKYLSVTYGKAARYIAQYIDTMNSIMKKRAKDLDLYDTPKMHRYDYLSAKAISEYLRLIDLAFESEKDNADIIYRLEEIKINILYAKLNETSSDKSGKKSAFEEFFRLVDKHRIDRYNEWNKPTLEELQSKYKKSC